MPIRGATQGPESSTSPKRCSVLGRPSSADTTVGAIVRSLGHDVDVSLPQQLKFCLDTGVFVPARRHERWARLRECAGHTQLFFFTGEIFLKLQSSKWLIFFAVQTHLVQIAWTWDWCRSTATRSTHYYIGKNVYARYLGSCHILIGYISTVIIWFVLGMGFLVVQSDTFLLQFGEAASQSPSSKLTCC